MTFQVCFVTRNDETNTLLEDTCKYLGIPYYERYYNSRRYSVDRDYIEKLPAFHVFENNQHAGTYYPDKDIYKLESLVTNYKIRQMKRKTYSWKRILGRLLKTDSISNKKQTLNISTHRH